ncbi:MAG: hypothetical protein WD009_12240 [Phycisphaeraceae bacterium]
MNYLPSLMLTLTLLAAPACAAAEAYEPDASPPPAAASTPDADASVEEWLDAIEARSADLDTLRGQVAYLRVQRLLGDRQTRYGTLVYDAGPPTRFDAHFDRIAVLDRIEEQDHRFTFDGRWLAERLADRRQFILRELVPADQVGENLLRLGQGPFAIPLDLKRDTVLERFEVELVDIEPAAAAEGEAGEQAGDAFAEAHHGVPPVDVDGTVRLRLTPREGVEIDQSRIELWYDRELLLPVRVYTVDEENETESVISLGRFETGVEVDEAQFSVEPPDEPGWQIERRLLEDEQG